MKYVDEEINISPFNLAIQYDKRTYCSYYISLLRTKHNMKFAFSNNDCNSKIIKLDSQKIINIFEYLKIKMLK